jgi:hypothetical protein
MSMPINDSSNNRRPIEIAEDSTHFLVRIHPEDRDRAKKIAGRSWDGDRRAWVYEKDQSTYEALKEEFQNDAKIFDIRRPKNKRPTGITPPAEDADDGQFDEEIAALGNLGESQGKILNELEQIRQMLGSLGEASGNQSQTLSSMCRIQEQTARAIDKFESPIQQIVQTEPLIVLPDELNPENPRELELLEKVLVNIACLNVAPEWRPSFSGWMSKYQPLRLPSSFVTRMHESLKRALGNLVGDTNPRRSFKGLVDQAIRDKLIFADPNDLTKEPILILKSLNFHRNYFGHPNDDQSEAWNRSILYLMNLPLIWSIFASDLENFDG